MNHTTPEATLSRWQAEGILARIGCTPEYIFNACRKYERIPGIKNLNDREVRRIRGDRLSKPRVLMTPKTWAEKVKAARNAVRLVKTEKMLLNAALEKNGLGQHFSTGLRQCVDGAGDVLDSVKLGTEPPDHPSRSCAAFCRWFLDKPGPMEDNPENEKLRQAIKRSDLTLGQIARGAGMHISNLTAFVIGEQRVMMPHNRDRVWQAIGGRS